MLLSTREVEVLRFAANGYLDKEIAAAMDVEVSTVRTHWDRARGKLKAINRTHAVSLAMALGLISVEIGPLFPG
jgi:DNA-binding NarL/FixJ family response regulator